MNGFPHLAQQIFNRPLAIEPGKAQIILGALAGRLGIAQVHLPDGSLRAFADAPVMTVAELPEDDDACGYQVISGVAVIGVQGSLAQRQRGLQPISGMTGYNAIRLNFVTALEDPEVRAIAFDIDSPGGDVAGLFDLTDEIYAARGRKPVWALLNESACSAAYALAAATDKIVIPRTGYAGSIGVLLLHADLSRVLEGAGITVSIIQFGARKADGQPSIPLSDPARAALQADVDAIGELFVQSVALYRGLSTARIRATEAAVFLGGAGRAPGLVDVVCRRPRASRHWRSLPPAAGRLRARSCRHGAKCFRARAPPSTDQPISLACAGLASSRRRWWTEGPRHGNPEIAERCQSRPRARGAAAAR
ncbi:MAG TPA: S49 family peptidase [Stellaceae bacterium]|jgi:ClpP class serine protease